MLPGDVSAGGLNESKELGTNGPAGPVTFSSAPVTIAGPAAMRSVAVGNAATCALTIRGEVLCWRANAFGELDNGMFDT